MQLKWLSLELVTPAKFPLAKKRHTLEHLRDIAHLRSRTNTVVFATSDS